jgi:hypothetical protein
MPNFPVDPPLGVPSKIQLDQIDPLTFAEADGGGRLPQDAPLPPQVVTRIDGDSSGVFSVISIETLRLVPSAPDVPHSSRVWATMRTVDGPGPIQTRGAQALDITVGFACPAKPQKSYSAIAVVLADCGASPPLMEILIQATVNPCMKPFYFLTLGIPKLITGALARAKINSRGPASPA